MSHPKGAGPAPTVIDIEAGAGRAEMGPAADQLQTWDVSHGFAVFIPAGQWQNVVDTGDEPLKL